MVRKTKEKAERTYHTLLDAATTLFIRQGVANTTPAEIAAEAGMNHVAVYWHFDNKGTFPGSVDCTSSASPLAIAVKAFRVRKIGSGQLSRRASRVVAAAVVIIDLQCC